MFKRVWVIGLALLALGGAQAEPIFSSSFEPGEGPPPPSEPSGGLGANLDSMVDFASAYVFTDFFKQSRPWITSAPNGCTPPAIPGASCFDTLEGDLLDLDADGWVASLPACADPGQVFCIARTVLNAGNQAWPSGNYLVIYDGQGTVTYGLGASKLAAQSVHGRDVVQVNGNAIWQLDITATDPADPIRNIRIFPPGFDPAAGEVPTFHPDFLAELTPYRSLRFMDWMHTNGGGFSGVPNTQENFGDRPRVTDAHWTREGGVPLEIMIELSNLTGTEPWFTLPHRANDGYVDGFAAIVRDQLAEGRRVYVEYSNEVWNPAFPQGGEIQQRGNAVYGALGDPFIRRLNMHGQRTAEICERFKTVFGSQSGQVVCVLGAQAANAFTQTEAADCPLAIQTGQRANACHNAIDAVAIAPYFANYTNLPVNADEIQGWTLDQVFAELNQGGQLLDLPPGSATPCTENFPPVNIHPCPISALEEVVPWITAHKSAATARNLSVTAYEGGQHLVGVFGVENNNAITSLFTSANRDTRMGAAYTQYLNAWKDNGGELFMVFSASGSYSRFGSWGIVERLNQVPRPPKALAIDTFNADNPCWWPDCNVGGGGGAPPPPPPPPPPPGCDPAQLVSDPSLEATDFSDLGNVTNPFWASTSAVFGTVLCSGGSCPDDGGTAEPRTGSVWAWFGGLAEETASTLSQTVTIPSGSARHLNFFLRQSFVTAPFDAELRVKVNGNTLRTFVEPATAEGAYVQRTVDLSAFANGAAHTIEFEYVNPPGSGKSSFILDDITLDCSASGS